MASRGGTGKAPASSSSEEDPHLSESMARVKQMAEMANLAASRLVGDVDGSTRAAATGARRGLTRSRGAGDDDHDD